MNRTHTFSSGGRARPASRPMDRLPNLEVLSRQKERQLDIRGLAATLEAMLGAIGGYGYACLLGQSPRVSNAEALRLYVESQIGDNGQLPDLISLAKQVRRALDRAQQACDEI